MKSPLFGGAVNITRPKPSRK